MASNCYVHIFYVGCDCTWFHTIAICLNAGSVEDISFTLKTLLSNRTVKPVIKTNQLKLKTMILTVLPKWKEWLMIQIWAVFEGSGTICTEPSKRMFKKRGHTARATLTKVHLNSELTKSTPTATSGSALSLSFNAPLISLKILLCFSLVLSPHRVLWNSASSEWRILSLEVGEGMGLQDRDTSEAQNTERKELSTPFQLPGVSSSPQY